MAEALFIDGPADRVRREVADPAPPEQYFITFRGVLSHATNPDIESAPLVDWEKHLYARSRETSHRTVLYEYIGRVPTPY